MSQSCVYTKLGHPGAPLYNIADVSSTNFNDVKSTGLLADGVTQVDEAWLCNPAYFDPNGNVTPANFGANHFPSRAAGLGTLLPILSFTSGIVAHAGGGQSSAVPITTTLNRIATVATTADSVKLPTALPGAEVIISNRGANSCNVYPNTGDVIDTGSANAALALPANARYIYVCALTGFWETIRSA